MARSAPGDDGLVLSGDLEAPREANDSGTVLGQSGLPRNADGSIARQCVPNSMVAERMAAGQTVSFAQKITERGYEEK